LRWIYIPSTEGISPGVWKKPSECIYTENLHPSLAYLEPLNLFKHYNDTKVAEFISIQVRQEFTVQDYLTGLEILEKTFKSSKSIDPRTLLNQSDFLYSGLASIYHEAPDTVPLAEIKILAGRMKPKFIAKGEKVYIVPSRYRLSQDAESLVNIAYYDSHNSNMPGFLTALGATIVEGQGETYSHDGTDTQSEGIVPGYFQTLADSLRIVWFVPPSPPFIMLH